MKYYLLQKGEVARENELRAFTTSAERDTATIKSIFGESFTEDEKLQWISMRMELVDRGYIDFEGDPGLEWFIATDSSDAVPTTQPAARDAEIAREFASKLVIHFSPGQDYYVANGKSIILAAAKQIAAAKAEEEESVHHFAINNTKAYLALDQVKSASSGEHARFFQSPAWRTALKMVKDALKSKEEEHGDTKRLNWLIAHSAYLSHSRDGEVCNVWLSHDPDDDSNGAVPAQGYPQKCYHDAREAIDAARAQSASGGKSS